MAFAVVSFSVVFLLITSGGLLLFYREAMLQRISEVINPQRKKRTLLTTIQETGLTIGGVVEHFDAVIPKSKAEVSITMKRLTRAGFRNESAVKLFYGCKVLIPLVLCAIALVSGLGKHNALFMYGAALGLGFLGPDFWLGRRIKARQYKLRKGLARCARSFDYLHRGRTKPGPGNGARLTRIGQGAAGDVRGIDHGCARTARRPPSQRSLEASCRSHRPGLHPQSRFHADSIGAARNQHRQNLADPL